MKGKRHTTEDKFRILRAADGGKSIVEICKERNIVTGGVKCSHDGRGQKQPPRVGRQVMKEG